MWIHFHFDENGRLIVDKVPDSHHEIECDTVIFSVGQRAGLAFIPDDAGVGITGKQTIAINPNTLAATREGVFAAGDSVSGTSFVIEAVDSGHTAARSIIRFLQGKHLEPPRKPELPVVQLQNKKSSTNQRSKIYTPSPRIPLPELPSKIASLVLLKLNTGMMKKAPEPKLSVVFHVESAQNVCPVSSPVEEMQSFMMILRKTQAINVGGMIFAPGFKFITPNFLKSLDLVVSRMLSHHYNTNVCSLPAGPTDGHVKRPGDDKSPKRIAFLQCVGSRDQDHDYCSSVCCMYAAKEAMMTIEHARAEALYRSW